MTLHTLNPNPNSFVRFMRQIYNPIGFKKGYNAILWFIFSGAMFGFLLARLQYLSIDGAFKKGAVPGEFFFYSKRFYHIGITLHLACILPGALLALVQFLPVVRYKLLILHRINGYMVILLLFGANVGALMIARHAFGGTLSTQLAVGVLAIATTISASLAIYNIKTLQIDQHRAWMLRTWFYAASIITMRIIMILSVMIISKLDSFNIAMPCGQIAYASGAEVAASYPGCTPNTYSNGTAGPHSADGSQGFAVVHASFKRSAHETAAAFQLTFGMAFWLAFVLHAVGIELYLALTPAESERLRKVSYERQLERGFKNPGSAGLTVDRFGDTEPWRPAGVVEKERRVVADSASESS